MQILCKASEGDCDVSCPVCGQGFQIYWTRSFSGERSTRVEIQQALLNQHGHNRELPHPGQEFSVSVATLPGYFETMHMPLRRGRYLDKGDIADAPHAVVISESLGK